MGDPSQSYCMVEKGGGHLVWERGWTVKSDCSNKQCMSAVTMAFTGLYRNLHIMVGYFSLDDLYLCFASQVHAD